MGGTVICKISAPLGDAADDFLYDLSSMQLLYRRKFDRFCVLALLMPAWSLCAGEPSAIKESIFIQLHHPSPTPSGFARVCCTRAQLCLSTHHLNPIALPRQEFI
jgi:hypothetical protein